MVDQEKQQLPVSSDYHTTITVPMVEWACQVSQLRVSMVQYLLTAQDLSNHQ